MLRYLDVNKMMIFNLIEYIYTFKSTYKYEQTNEERS